MITLLTNDLIDPETEAHLAYHKSLKSITGIHNHDFYELFLITEGTVYHIINGKKVLLEEGTLVFIRPADIHYYEKHGSKDCQVLNFAFPKVTMEALYLFLGKGFHSADMLSSLSPPQCILSKMEINHVISKFHKLTMIPNYQKQVIKTELRAFLVEIFITYFSQRNEEMKQSIPNWLEKLTQEMKKKENFTAGLPRLQELNPKSDEHLCRLLKKHYNQTTTQWINDFRLHYAANLLIYTDDDILTVSLDAGFDNLSHFYHLFKKKFYISPAKYRKLNRKIDIPE